ncbi:MAG: hypothetical protein RL562_884, partial [Planctomycetota bacterium]
MSISSRFRLPAATLSSLVLAGLIQADLTAQAGIPTDVPTGGVPSPLFGAQPFVRKLLRFEEFGTYDFPTVRAMTGRALPTPPATDCCPTGPELDAFMEAAENMFPWPERRA